VFNGGVIYGGQSCSQVKVPITLPLVPGTAVASFNSNVQANGATVDFDASGSTGTSYNWSFGDGNLGTGMITSHTYAQAGTYNVTLLVTESDCNTADTITQTVVATVGIEETLLGQSLNIFPNPNAGQFRVSFMVEGVKHAQLRVMNAIGQTMYEFTPGNISGEYKHDIDLSREAAGVYILQVITDDGIISRRVTVNK
jgi:PKD repeat protein